MRTLFLSLLLLLVRGEGKAQPGFSKWFDFGSAATYNSVILKGDTLILCGTSKDLALNQWGVLFVLADTLGNIIEYKLHLDTMGGQYAFGINSYPFEMTADSGFILGGSVLNRDSYFVMKLDKSGDLQFFKEYANSPAYLSRYPKSIIESTDGYFIFNLVQRQNGETDGQMVKINKEGEVQWQKYFGDYSISENLGTVFKENENSMIIGMGREAGPPPSPNLTPCFQNWIVGVDSLGEINWEWSSEPCLGGIITNIQKTSEGNWIYGNEEPGYFDWFLYGAAPKIVKRNSSMDLVWETKLAESFSQYTSVPVIIPDPDGTLVGIGAWMLPEPYYPDNISGAPVYVSSSVFKLDDEGAILWIHSDTIAFENTSTYYPDPRDLVILPGGSILYAGTFQEWIPGLGGKSWAWLVKVDKNGCMKGPCAPVVALEPIHETLQSPIRLYPNPAREILEVEFSAPGSHPYHITDLLGREWGSGRISSREEIRILDYPPGIYVLTVSGIGVSRVVIAHH